jgi:hypothetical protein
MSPPLLFPPARPASPEVGVHHKPWEHTLLKMMSWGGLATAGLALAPVLFSFGNGTSAMMANQAVVSCVTGPPRGLAGEAYGLLQDMGFSSSLVSGGLATAGISGGIAIGGLLLANYLDKRTQPGAFRWGAVVRWTALSTSILIALPAILPAISMGLNFLGMWSGSLGLQGFAADIGTLGTASAAATAAASAGGNVAATAGVSTAMGAAGLAVIHALTCALPLGITGLFLGQKEEPKKPLPPMAMPNLQLPPLPKLQLPALGDGRVVPPLRVAKTA